LNNSESYTIYDVEASKTQAGYNPATIIKPPKINTKTTAQKNTDNAETMKQAKILTKLFAFNLSIFDIQSSGNNAGKN